MTDGTSQGLFLVVAIVIFGIFVGLAYTVFGSGLTNDLKGLFETSIENSFNTKELVYTWDKELHAFGKFSHYDPITTVPRFENNYGHGEFLSYTDLSQVFDEHGLGKYQLSFYLKTSKSGIVRVYAQNGTTARHQWKNYYLDSSTEYQRFDLTIDVELLNSSEVKTMLAFYGTYGTEVLPSVKNVQLYKITPK